MNYNDIHKAIERACNICDVPELASKITFKFSRRMTRCAGNANYSRYLLTFSTIFWERADADELRNTVYHEVCHLITFEKAKWTDQFGRVRFNRPQPHGYEWKMNMYKCGENPTRTHNVDMGPKRNRKTVYCCCGDRTIGPIKYKRMLRGINYRCTICKQIIQLNPVGVHYASNY
jgi:predicted SprT family Zn-dependent metalloprotease